jgi:hypothetical protein
MANEMVIDEYKQVILSMILAYYLKYYGLTRRHVKKGGYTKEQQEWIKKAQQYYRQNFYGKIHFVKLHDYGMDSSKRVIKRLA